MSALGIIPTDTYLLTVGEVSTFLRRRNIHEIETSVSSAWRTINFLGALLADKFRSLDRYMPQTPERVKKDEARKKELAKQFDKL